MRRARRESPNNDGLRICPLCTGTSFALFRFGLLRCGGCGLVVNPALFRQGAGEALNEEAFGEGWEPETSFWVRWVWGASSSADLATGYSQ